MSGTQRCYGTSFCLDVFQEQQKEVIKSLKDEKRRKLVLLGEQYDQSISEMLQKQTVRLDESQMVNLDLYTSTVYLNYLHSRGESSLLFFGVW